MILASGMLFFVNKIKGGTTTVQHCQYCEVGPGISSNPKIHNLLITGLYFLSQIYSFTVHMGYFLLNKIEKKFPKLVGLLIAGQMPAWVVSYVI